MITLSMRNVTTDSGTVLISRFLVSLINLLFIPLLTKNLPTSDYGVWAQAWVTIPLFGNLLVLGFDEAITRFFPSMDRKGYSKDLISLLVPVLSFSLVVSLSFYLLSGQISSWLFDGNVKVARYIAMILFIWALDLMLYAFIRALRKMKVYSILIVVQNFFEIGLAVTMVLMGKGVENAVLSILLTRLGIMAFFLVYSTRYVDLARPELKNIRRYAIYGIPTLPMVLSSWVLSSFDHYMIAIFYTSTEVGYYDPAYILGQSVPLLVAESLSFTLTPHLSKLYDASETAEVKKILSFMFKMALAINMPFILGGIVLSRPILALISTESIAANAYMVLPLVSTGVSLFCLQIVASQVWKLEKKTYYIGITYVISAVLNIVLNLILIPIYGIEGAAIATMFAYGSGLFITWALVNKHFAPELDILNLAKISLSSVAMFAIVYAIYNYSPVLNTGLALVCGMLAYALFISKSNIISGDERDVLKEIRFVRRIIK